MKSSIKIRCTWPKEQITINYHDTEWGVPIFNDNGIFELIILESAQAGLSWATILKKRNHYRRMYSNFNPHIVANYDNYKISLLLNSQIIRNKNKILASIENAKSFCKIQKECNTFYKYIWNFTGNKVVQTQLTNEKLIPSSSILSEYISHKLSQKGFKYFGPTICYSFLQSIGMINDHTTKCFRHKEIQEMQILNRLF